MHERPPLLRLINPELRVSAAALDINRPTVTPPTAVNLKCRVCSVTGAEYPLPQRAKSFAMFKSQPDHQISLLLWPLPSSELALESCDGVRTKHG